MLWIEHIPSYLINVKRPDSDQAHSDILSEKQIPELLNDI